MCNIRLEKKDVPLMSKQSSKHSAACYLPQGKVMFSQMSVCLHGDLPAGGGLPTRGVLVESASWRPPPLVTSSCNHGSGRYASYWKASLLVSTYIICERLSAMHKQVSVQLTSNSKFLSKFSRKPLSGISHQKAPPLMKNFRFEMTKVYSGIPPMKNFRFEMTKVYSGIPPPK